jgi:hypothetical protein
MSHITKDEGEDETNNSEDEGDDEDDVAATPEVQRKWNLLAKGLNDIKTDNKDVKHGIQAIKDTLKELEDRMKDVEQHVDTAQMKEAKKHRAIEKTLEAGSYQHHQYEHLSKLYDKKEIEDILYYDEPEEEEEDVCNLTMNKSNNSNKRKNNNNNNKNKRIKGSIDVPIQEQKRFQSFLDQLDSKMNSSKPDPLFQAWSKWHNIPPETLVIRNNTVMGRILKDYFPTLTTTNRTTKVGLCKAKAKWA